MKRLLAILTVCGFAATTFAYPLTTNTASVTIDSNAGHDYGQFNWKIAAYSDSYMKWTFNQSVSNSTCSFKMSQYPEGGTGRVTYLYSTNVTVAATVVTCTTSRTNFPPSGVYDAEVWAVDIGSGYAGPLARGKITVTYSLFDTTPDTFTFPVASTDLYVYAIQQLYNPMNWANVVSYANTAASGPYRFTAVAYAGITTNADGSINIPAPVAGSAAWGTLTGSPYLQTDLWAILATNVWGLVNIPSLPYTRITNSPWLTASSNLSDLASAATARTNLGLAVGVNVQAYDADLDDLADGSLTPSKVGISTFGQTLVDDADASAGRATLGLGTAATNPASAFATAAQGEAATNAQARVAIVETNAVLKSDGLINGPEGQESVNWTLRVLRDEDGSDAIHWGTNLVRGLHGDWYIDGDLDMDRGTVSNASDGSYTGVLATLNYVDNHTYPASTITNPPWATNGVLVVGDWRLDGDGTNLNISHQGDVAFQFTATGPYASLYPNYRGNGSQLTGFTSAQIAAAGGMVASNLMESVWTNITWLTAVNGTCTVNRSHGSLVGRIPTNNSTLVLNPADFPTGTVDVVSLLLYVGTNSWTWTNAISSVTFSNAPVLPTNAWADIITLTKNFGSSNAWKGVQQQ